MSDTAGASHFELCLLADKWLRSRGFGVVFRDGFKATVDSGEIPDAIGWRGGISALIEVKVSRADFLADKSKPFRVNPAAGMGDWRFYLCPPGVIAVSDLPPGWGLLHSDGKKVRSVHGVPGNCDWRAKRPFDGAKLCENQMMYSALRRVTIRGHFGDIYDSILTGCPDAA
jgi:hypothetical protein